MTEQGGTRLPYVPGLDGIRGLSLMVMIGYHMQLSWIPGALFVIPVFFTLSGYLITQLLVLEHRNRGRVSMKKFWGTRVRRLFPASVVCIGLIALISVTTDVFPGEGTRGDLLATLGYFFNWRILGSETSYAQMFANHSSPVHHFWSLTVEEQFYFVLPLVIVFLLARRRRWMLPVTLGAMFVASVLSGIAANSRNLVYYGTHVRAAEALVGVMLALVFPAYRTVGERARRVIAAASVPTLALAVFVIAKGSLNDRWVYEGGLALCSLISVPIILGVLVPGPVRWLFGNRLLVETGKISYGLYVFHWPILVIMNPDRMGFDGAALFALRLAVIIAVGLASNHFIELPIRRRRRIANPRIALGVLAVALVVALALVSVVPTRSEPALAGVNAPDEIVSFGNDTKPADVTEPSIVVNEPDARVVVFGSQSGAAELLTDAIPTGSNVEVVDRTQPGCAVRPRPGRVGSCFSIGWLFDHEPDERRPDFVVLSVGAAERELIDEMYGTAEVGQPTDPQTTARVELEVRLDYLAALVDVFGDTPVLILDNSARDALQQDLADVAERDVKYHMVLGSAPATLSREVAVIMDGLTGLDDRTRVMVIGDSNSFAVAQGIDDAAGDVYNVLWAGGRNCPIVPIQRLRWWEGVDFDLSSCPTFDGEWSAAIADFRPNVLLIVVTGSEQSEQMYEPDGEWFVLGSERFDALHRDEMTKLMAQADLFGTKVVFFNSPNVYGGAFKNAPFSQPERVAAWNAMIGSFVAAWPQIGVIDWAAILGRAETANGGELGSLRGDGLHMEGADMSRLMKSDVLPALEAMLAMPAG